MQRFKAEFTTVHDNLQLVVGYQATFQADNRRDAMGHCGKFIKDNFGDYRLNKLTRLPPPQSVCWGRHPEYANGVWIKLVRGRPSDCLAEERRREEEGRWELRIMPKGEHPGE